MGTRRRVRRRVRDSDSDDAPMMQVDLHSWEEGRGQVGQRRVMLVPEESQGTPQSVQDREPPSTVPVTTFPSSSGTVRRLVLVQSQQREPISGSTTVPASSGVVRTFQNRFEALREPEQIVDEEQGQVLGEAGRSVMGVSAPRATHTPVSVGEEQPVATETIPDHDDLRRFEMWKLFMLLPRMLLCRSLRGGPFPKGKLVGQFDKFASVSGRS